MSILQIKKVFGNKTESRKIVEPKKAATKKMTSHTKAAAVTKKAKETQKKKTKSSSKELQKVGLVCAVGDQCFWANDGLVLATLADLRDAFASMSEETYSHHVTQERNDFADWVALVLLDAKCAQDLRRARSVADSLDIVTKRLASYVV